MKIKKFLFLIVLLLLLPIRINADEIDFTKKSSITGIYSYDKESLVNVNTSIYKIATLNSDYTYTFEESLISLEKDISELSTSQYNEYAITLRDYIKKNNIKSLATSSTDTDGKFYYKNLDAGLYLIDFPIYNKNGYVYEADPLLMPVPNRMYLYENYSYDVNSLVKVSREKATNTDSEEGVPNTGTTILRTLIISISVVLVGLIFIMFFPKKEVKNNEKE